MSQLSQFGLVVLLFFISLDLYAEERVQREVKVLGRKISVSQSVSDLEKSGVESKSEISLFGKKIEIAKSSVKYQVNENEGMSYRNNFSVNGRKILVSSFVNDDGSFDYSAEVPFMEISGDLFSYSFGILSLGVNSGVTFEGDLKASLSSELLKEDPFISDEMNLAKASASVDVLTKGYVEGQVKILFVKGGVGGSINLIEGEAGAEISTAPVNLDAPEINYFGSVHLLRGQLYGYVGSGHSKWLSHDFYTSNGYCYGFGSKPCL
jgi:hypothetical protein